MKLKRMLIVALVIFNVGLLAALVIGTNEPAPAQVIGGGADYLMVTANIGGDYDAVYIIDLARRRMMSWRMDKTRKRLVAYKGRELSVDFNRETRR